MEKERAGKPVGSAAGGVGNLARGQATRKPHPSSHEPLVRGQRSLQFDEGRSETASGEQVEHLRVRWRERRGDGFWLGLRGGGPGRRVAPVGGGHYNPPAAVFASPARAPGHLLEFRRGEGDRAV